MAVATFHYHHGTPQPPPKSLILNYPRCSVPVSAARSIGQFYIYVIRVKRLMDVFIRNGERVVWFFVDETLQGWVFVWKYIRKRLCNINGSAHKRPLFISILVLSFRIYTPMCVLYSLLFGMGRLFGIIRFRQVLLWYPALSLWCKWKGNTQYTTGPQLENRTYFVVFLHWTTVEFYII